MKLLPELLTMMGQKITCLNVENATSLESPNLLAMPLRNLSEVFGLRIEKSWYPHLFNSSEEMNYVGPAHDTPYCEINQMHTQQRKEL